jgi:putative FmdB family regulatory protein
MPIYLYQCGACPNRFEAYAPVEDRDRPQVCDYCGVGADRVFTPAAINIGEFANWSRSTFDLTLDECRAREKQNEAYLAAKPPSKPSYEECIKKELDTYGIRHPNRLVDNSQAAQIDLAHRMRE